MSPSLTILLLPTKHEFNNNFPCTTNYLKSLERHIANSNVTSEKPSNLDQDNGGKPQILLLEHLQSAYSSSNLERASLIFLVRNHNFITAYFNH